MTRRQFLASLLPASLLQQGYPPPTVAPHIDVFYGEYKDFEFLAATMIGNLVRRVKRLEKDVPGRGKYPFGGKV